MEISFRAESETALKFLKRVLLVKVWVEDLFWLLGPNILLPQNMLEVEKYEVVKMCTYMS